MSQPASSASSDGALARWLPISHWLRRYTREDFGGDLSAGIITAILLVPQGMAFALLAGLPPQVGLYASILPPIAYATLGTSRALAVGPVSVAAIMVAHALHDLPPGSDPAAAALMLAARAARARSGQTVETWPRLLFMRVDENMTFTNAGHVESAIVSEIAAHPSAQHVILVMSSVSAIDSTAVETMERLAQSLRPTGLSLHLSDVKGPVMDRLRHSHRLATIAPGKVFLSANAAAEELSRQQD